MSIYENRPSKMDFFWCQGIFFMNFDFNNGCNNEFQDYNEKLCSWTRNRFSRKIDFKAEWPRKGHADSVGVKYTFDVISQIWAHRFFAVMLSSWYNF